MAPANVLEQKFPRTEDRSAFMTAKFAVLLSEEGEFEQILAETQERASARMVSNNFDEDVSEYWIRWAVDGWAWGRAMKLKAQSPPDDVAHWLTKLKKDRAIIASLDAAERKAPNLPIMDELPFCNPDPSDMTPRELRQEIWDSVFPDTPTPSQGRPFELVMCRGIDYAAHVVGNVGLKKLLPRAVRVWLVDRLIPDGKMTQAMVFGYHRGSKTPI
ncbi:uncharacterized protein ColSpa_09604 [Colletotrichum spaethianum]|uniref:Uncharacterized protein n=1 Tax=Colletotrichum spaethianum TaxID=700344 RepID=A0AA37PBZ2_9PEZI|nr:uncharacterized protein ColSpa_09604 [Colletotrichum spaethianum]GKT49423.1 hypothetical protein ColSpa_09604 [Colletotrichum spaethianum]